MKQRIDSFRYAWKGIVDLVRTQMNARIHVGFTMAVLISGWYFSISVAEWSLVILCIFLVLAAEAFNTALEYLTDLVSPDFHPLAGKTKDMAAAGVLLTAIGASAVGLIIFLPKFIELLLG